MCANEVRADEDTGGIFEDISLFRKNCTLTKVRHLTVQQFNVASRVLTPVSLLVITGGGTCVNPKGGAIEL